MHGWKDGQVPPRYGGRHDGACLLLWQGKRGLRSVSRSDTNAWHSDLLGLVSVFHPWLFEAIAAARAVTLAQCGSMELVAAFV